MRTINLNSVKDCSAIYGCGEYVVATGRTLWIFRKDGSFVAKSKTIRYASKVTFLPPDTIFVAGGSDNQYHYVSLLTGEDIWSFPEDRKRTMMQRKFAVSPDRKTLYDMYCSVYKGRDILYIEKIDLNERTVQRAEVPESLRVTYCIYTDEEGVLYALQSHYIADEKRKQNGILKIDWTGSEPLFSWERLWQSEAGPDFMSTDGRYILRSDYSVLDLKTMQTFSLLENEPEWKPREGYSECVYLQERNLLICYYLFEDIGNVIVDCAARKRVAQYDAMTPLKAGYKGCLIDNEYWIGTPEGIKRKEFPIFEEMPERKILWWGDL